MMNEDEESTSGPNREAEFSTLILLAFKSITSPSNDDVAKIERMRGIIKSFGFYPEYSHFRHILILFRIYFYLYFLTNSIDVKRKISFCENFSSLHFKLRSESKLFLTRVNIYH